MMPAELRQTAIDLVYTEAMLLDEHRWADWLALYEQDCEFWMPMWRTEEAMNDSPATGLSHIYYASRAGLEDRIARIRSRKSPASSPLPRTTHIIGTPLLQEGSADHCVVRTSWSCHVVFPRHRDPHAFFGSNQYHLARAGDGWRIRRKHIKLVNDYVPTMLDIYCV
ncbi:MAG: aromatic-ring-hydroxylating dioxygenase subunit beta [Pigmentiphaga sp.]|uniref:aromatic-ring-hydroxylating dioxygenase subunit beta n=1 Tax=Pigmentiphaga sp. TaxID=1977564 RepID=UPI0029A4CECF|nr:aromatic-ring-hydroxylating dioxygenase subunit beta [Pigmentiphaga sp.]MDX3908037.1 aromatic-ring-hydroxylating dioxygenase subunit beta [Pigmentiphaga sp.]